MNTIHAIRTRRHLQATYRRPRFAWRRFGGALLEVVLAGFGLALFIAVLWLFLAVIAAL